MKNCMIQPAKRDFRNTTYRQATRIRFIGQLTKKKKKNQNYFFGNAHTLQIYIHTIYVYILRSYNTLESTF